MRRRCDGNRVCSCNVMQTCLHAAIQGKRHDVYRASRNQGSLRRDRGRVRRRGWTDCVHAGHGRGTRAHARSRSQLLGRRQRRRCSRRMRRRHCAALPPPTRNSASTTRPSTAAGRFPASPMSAPLRTRSAGSGGGVPACWADARITGVAFPCAMVRMTSRGTRATDWASTGPSATRTSRLTTTRWKC